MTEVNPPSTTGGLSVEVVCVVKFPGETLIILVLVTGERVPIEWSSLGVSKVVLFK